MAGSIEQDETGRPGPLAHRLVIRMGRMLAGLDLAGALFPPACPACGRRVGRLGGLCGTCWAQVHFIDEPCCDILGLPFGIDLGPGIVSAQAIADPPPFDKARAAVVHAGPARHLVHALKYKDRTDLAGMMGAWMVRAGSPLLSDADVLVPVPLARSRLFLRQYNQAAELARAVSRLSGVPMLEDALRRDRATRRQVGLTRQARKTNLAGAFAMTDSGRSDVFGRHVVLVDDVLTTGATAGAASRTLRRAGAARISVLTFAMALADTI